MKPGWKNDPVWRMYDDQRRAVRFALRLQRYEFERQQAAIDAEAAHIIQKVLNQSNNEPRH